MKILVHPLGAHTTHMRIIIKTAALTSIPSTLSGYKSRLTCPMDLLNQAAASDPALYDNNRIQLILQVTYIVWSTFYGPFHYLQPRDKGEGLVSTLHWWTSMAQQCFLISDQPFGVCTPNVVCILYIQYINATFASIDMHAC